MATTRTVPVLIVGGGPIGLCASVLLTHHGVPSLLIERHDTTAQYPKARFINARSMEIFRQCGLEEAVRATSLPPATVRHAIWAPNLVAPERQRAVIATVTPEGTAGLSPAPGCTTSQDLLEPVLLAAGQGPGGERRFGCELVAFTQDATGVTATLRDRATGEQTSVRARYLLGADGPYSQIRASLGIPMVGPGNVAHFVTILFRADLSPWTSGRSINLCMLQQAAAPGVLLNIDGHTRWCFMANYAPDLGQRAEDFTPDHCVALVRAAVGVPELPVEVLRVAPWSAAARVAASYRAGRVFLAGDAAHEMPPAGGFGLNVGIADVHNLAWKLAAVLGGWAGPGLLATYGTERAPVGHGVTVQIGQTIRTIATAWQSAARPAATGGGGAGAGPHPAGLDLFQARGLVFGAAYTSAAVVLDSSVPTAVANPVTDYAPQARPGCRAPHVWLARVGAPLATLDLFGRGFVLLAGASQAAWGRAAAAAAHALGVPLRTYTIGAGGDLTDPTGTWASVYGVAPTGAVLVRPDGHVAWRTQRTSADAWATLARTLGDVLGREAAVAR